MASARQAAAVAAKALSPPRLERRARRATRPRCAAGAGSNTELLICMNRTCRKQGSMNLLEAASELLPPGVHLERRGCLGRCGSGPNVCLMPSGLLVSYCATPAQLAHLIELQCVGGGGTRLMQHALELRVQGNALAERGKLAEAEALYTQALAVGAPRGAHLALANRSAVRLQRGDTAGALADALAAQADGPADWTRGFVREAEARAAAGDAAGAQHALDRAAEIDAFVLTTPEVMALQEETTFVNIEDEGYESD